MKIILTILFILISEFVIGQNPSTSGYLLTNENGSVSIGTKKNTAPLTIANFSTTFPTPQTGTIVHLLSDAVTNGRISFDTYNDAGIQGSNYQGRRARGTAALPTAATLDDVLVAIGADGWGDDSYTGISVGSMNIRANGTFTNASKPTYISFTTTPSGSITQVERVRIKPDGVFQITGLNSVGFLQTDANGNFSTAALSGANITTALGYTPQTNLISGTNIKTINGGSVLGSGDLVVNGAAAWGSVTGTLSNQTDLQNALDGKQASLGFTPANVSNNLGDLTSAPNARTNLGLGNVTNESKATMFTSPTFTGTPVVPSAITVGGNTITFPAVAATLLPNTTTSGVAASPTASGTVTVTHNLGRIPTTIRIKSISSFTSNAAATPVPFSEGTFNSTGNRCLYMVINGTTTQVSQTSTVFSIIMVTSAGNSISGVIGNVTSTTFDIVFTETGTHTAGNYLWEAQ